MQFVVYLPAVPTVKMSLSPGTSFTVGLGEETSKRGSSCSERLSSGTQGCHELLSEDPGQGEGLRSWKLWGEGP